MRQDDKRYGRGPKKNMSLSGQHCSLYEYRANIKGQRDQTNPTDFPDTGQDYESNQVNTKQRRNKIEGRTEGRIDTKLLCPATAISHQHSRKGLEVVPGTAMHDNSRVVNQFAATLLQGIHQGIFFIRIKRFVESSQLEHGIAAGDQITKDEFFLAGLARAAHRRVPRAARPERQPTSQHQSENLLERRRVTRAKVGAANHLDLRVSEILDRLAQVPPFRHRVVIEEINQFAPRGFQGGI